MTDEQIIGRTRTPAEHIEQAERYANTLESALASAFTSGKGFSSVDLQAYDLYMRAATIHLKLAQAKSLPVVSLHGTT